MRGGRRAVRTTRPRTGQGRKEWRGRGKGNERRVTRLTHCSRRRPCGGGTRTGGGCGGTTSRRGSPPRSSKPPRAPRCRHRTTGTCRTWTRTQEEG